MMKTLSIIIPTYNMSKYLNRCLDSLLVDTDNLEVLVINDGSKDNSSEIAHTYQDKYPNIYRVVDKENGNYGSCVNRGLKEATGKYVKVLDSDDYFDNKEFKDYLDHLNNLDVDLVLSDYSNVFLDSDKKEICILDMPDGKDAAIDDVVNSNLFKLTGMHAMAYKREILLNCGYKQTEGISYTDQEWIFTPMAYVKTCHYLKNNVYQYVKGREGQTVDESSYRKNISQLVTVAESNVRSYATVNTLVSLKVKEYLHFKLMRLLCDVYRRFLLKEGYDFSLCADFDKTVREFYPSIINDLDQVSIYGFHYIKYYHTKHSCSPFLFRKIYQIGKKILS